MTLRQFAVFLALFLFLIAPIRAAPESLRGAVLSDRATVSLWTVGPGTELYTAFGHTALRITDPVIGFDRVYNFGTFDFDTPNFYLKFIQGDLDYFLTAAIAPEVLEEYRANHQLVIEQQLNLSSYERDALFLAMEENLEPAHAAYRYDFVRDNCTTRIRDAVGKVAHVLWQPLEQNAPTLREMVQPYVADRPPIQTGINLLFGANMDHPATNLEAMFLPEDMKKAFDRAIIADEVGERPLVKSTTVVLDGPALPPYGLNWLVIATYLLAGVAMLALGLGKSWPRWFDIVLFCLVGFIGCFIAFVWFGTRHWVLHNNWNLLWAWPTHLLIWFFPKRIQRKYWEIYLAAIALSTLLPYIFQRGIRPKWENPHEFLTFLGVKVLLLASTLATFKIDVDQRDR